MENQTELSLAASFPVIFFNGEREIDIGNILIHPFIGFRRFKTIISQKIGVSPSQISTSLVLRKQTRSSAEISWKVPIVESSDFSEIAQERDGFVLAILNRSRRNSRSRRRERGASVSSEKEMVFPEKTILKRYPPNELGIDDTGTVGLRRLSNYENQVHNMETQRGMYMMFPESALPLPLPPDPPEMLSAAGESARPVVCEECMAAGEEGRSEEFHWCVNDAVTVGFRSPVGPIQRPSY